MRSVEDIRRELAAAERREREAQIRCTSCDGKGWLCDTTYVRAGGEDVRCARCHGTGLPKAEVDRILLEAFGPFHKPVGGAG